MALGAYAFAARGKAQGSQPNGRLFRNVERCGGQVARASILVGFSTKKTIHFEGTTIYGITHIQN